ncbi:MAG: adenosylcobinamide-GDP ribazoletransferase [Anaerolineae bacterium]|nr:adenosylcobinamide-GDP ribazoletransferase [Anaerolineae bacterium]
MWADLRTAWAFLTIVPVGFPAGERPAGWSFGWFWLVGLAIGAGILLLRQVLPLPPEAAAFVVLLAWVVVTGGLHLDGFGDSCDGVLSTAAPERRLEIMKDPRTGSWAVIGLVMLLLGKWLAIAQTAPLLLLVAPVAGRCAMVWAAQVFPYARTGNSLGGYFRNGLGWRQVIGCSAGALLVVMWVGGRAWLAVPVAAVTVGLVGGWMARRLGGGLTGDSYGAICELTEVLCVWGMATWAS